MTDRGFGLIVFLLAFAPSFGLVCMTADHNHPSPRDWRLAWIFASISVTTALGLIVVSGSAGLLLGLVGGLIFGGLCGLYENSWGPEGSP